MRKLVGYFLLSALTVLPAAAQYTFNFSTPVVLSPTEAPGVWYTDRFPPNGFVSPAVAPDGTPNTLQETIAAGDVQPGVSFYNTQGRKFDIPPTTTSVTIALYVPAAWATFNGRLAGFWTTLLPNTGGGDFPIIEFQGPTLNPVLNGPGYYSNGGVAGFYGWNNSTGGFDLIGLPTGFVYNSWVQLTITFVPGVSQHVVYTVGNPISGGVSITSPLSVPGDTGLGNVILEGYNYGSTYSIFWDGTLGLAGMNTPDAYQSGFATGDPPVINVTNNGASGGNICVNVYAFDPTEELLSCCSCALTPNALQSLSVETLLDGNTATGEHPSSGSVALIASTTPAGTAPGTASDCSAAAPATLLPGMRAWATSLHTLPSSGGTFLTENAWSGGTLSPAEYAHLTSFCAFITDGLSGHGVCPGCAAGGQ